MFQTDYSSYNKNSKSLTQSKNRIPTHIGNKFTIWKELNKTMCQYLKIFWRVYHLSKFINIMAWASNKRNTFNLQAGKWTHIGCIHSSKLTFACFYSIQMYPLWYSEFFYLYIFLLPFGKIFFPDLVPYSHLREPFYEELSNHGLKSSTYHIKLTQMLDPTHK